MPAPPRPGADSVRAAGQPAAAIEGVPAFRTDIEGLRGVAVLLVVLYHAAIPGFTGGFVGVDVFFVLSGYLITALLVAEVRGTGRVDFVRFYSRRARRLLPAAGLMLVVTLAVGMFVFSPLEQASFSRSALGTALYASNLQFMLDAENYFAADLEANPFLHTWSLAVEEQFYLVWPFLVALALRGGFRRGRLAGWICAVTLLSLAGCLWLTYARPPWAFFGSPLRAWEFGVGALASLAPAALLARHAGAARAVGVAGLAGVAVAGTVFTSAIAFPGAAALLPVLATAAVLLAGAAAPGTGVGRLLAVAPLQRLGRLSYSWYLWHWPAIVVAKAVWPNASPAVPAAAALLSLAWAAAAYRLEDHVRYHPALGARPALTLRLAFALTAGTAVAALGLNRWAEGMIGRGPHRPYAAANQDRALTRECAVWSGARWIARCDALRPARVPTVVVFGDSHAAQWQPALRTLAGREGWRLVTMTKSACASADVQLANPRQRPLFAERCAAWRRRSLARIAALRPSLVVMSNSQAHVESGDEGDERDEAWRVSPAEWRAGLRRTLARLHGAGIPVLLIRDTPRMAYDVPACLSRAAWRPEWADPSCAADRDEAVDDSVFQAELAAARGLGLVRVRDLTHLFCGPEICPPERSGRVVYRDDDHVTRSFAITLAPVLGAEVRAALAAAPGRL